VKAVILAGGLGTRLSEETSLKPKPMVTIGEMPILWHIMKLYYHQGVDEFIICCGYKANIIKEFFINYRQYNSDVTVDGRNGSINFHNVSSEKWKVTLVDTGSETQTGGRLKRVKEYVSEDELFCFTYGDGLCDVDIQEVIQVHKSRGRLSTVVGVAPPGRYGAIVSDGFDVKSFTEKPRGDGALINGGFFVLSPKVLEFIQDDMTIWEQEPMNMLAQQQQMTVFKHNGFWQSMDTLREKQILEAEWHSGNARWKVW